MDIKYFQNNLNYMRNLSLLFLEEEEKHALNEKNILDDKHNQGIDKILQKTNGKL
jgi:hypothetical protein